METKYTTNGKKVRVVGKLNNTESIVQEIYVDSETGAEFPAGENFVVKSLLDSPAETWEKKECEKIKNNLKALQEKWETEWRKLHIETGAIRQMLNSLSRFKDKFHHEQLDQLIDFMSGDIGYVVLIDYSRIKIKTFLDTMKYVDYGSCDSLRLLSLYGKADGNLQWAVNHYSDGSGGRETVIPCKTHDDALMVAQNVINALVEKNGVSPGLLESAQEYGLIIPEEKMLEYKKQKKTNLSDHLDRLLAQVETTKKELMEYE